LAARLDVVMRHKHQAGEKMFVDYAGQTVDVIYGETGERHKAQIFVTVLCAFAQKTCSEGFKHPVPENHQAL
jgi:transposase